MGLSDYYTQYCVGKGMYCIVLMFLFCYFRWFCCCILAITCGLYSTDSIESNFYWYALKKLIWAGLIQRTITRFSAKKLLSMPL